MEKYKSLFICLLPGEFVTQTVFSSDTVCLLVGRYDKIVHCLHVWCRETSSPLKLFEGNLIRISGRDSVATGDRLNIFFVFESLFLLLSARSCL